MTYNVSSGTLSLYTTALTRRAANTNQPIENRLTFNRPTCYSILTNITCTTKLINTVARLVRANECLTTLPLTVFTQRNFVAFFNENRPFCVFEAPFGGLRGNVRRSS